MDRAPFLGAHVNFLVPLLRLGLCCLVATLASESMAVTEAPPRAPAVDLSFDASRGRLTAQIEAASLRDVLAVLAAATGAEVRGVPPKGEQRLSIGFRDLPLERGLERILAGSSYLLLFRGEGRARLVRVVLAAGSGERILPGERVPNAEDPASASVPSTITGADDAISSEPISDDESAGERIEAIGLLALSGEVELATAELRETLATDPDEEVRRVAFGALEELGPIPRDVLLDTALADPSLDLRLDALERLRRDGIGDADSVAALAELARRDPSPELRAIASDMLRQADGSADG